MEKKTFTQNHNTNITCISHAAQAFLQDKKTIQTIMSFSFVVFRSVFLSDFHRLLWAWKCIRNQRSDSIIITVSITGLREIFESKQKNQNIMNEISFSHFLLQQH